MTVESEIRWVGTPQRGSARVSSGHRTASEVGVVGATGAVGEEMIEARVVELKGGGKI